MFSCNSRSVPQLEEGATTKRFLLAQTPKKMWEAAQNCVKSPGVDVASRSSQLPHIGAKIFMYSHTLGAEMFYLGSLFWSKMLMFRRAGENERGREATPTSISIFDSSLASKCQYFKVEMSFSQPLCIMKLKTSKFKVLAFCCQWRYHYQIQITRSLYHKNQILKC